MLYIFHSSPLDLHRVTVVARYDGKRFLYATARCGGRDHFCRKKGVMIATGRLNKGKVVITGNTKEDSQVFVLNASTISSYLQKHSQVEFFKVKEKKPLLKRLLSQFIGNE